MLYKGDIGLYLSGGPVKVPMCGFFITQPRVKDICIMGESRWLMAISLITKVDQYATDIKKGNSQLGNMSDFQILLLMVKEQISIKVMLSDLFELICPSYKVEYSKNTIDFYITDEEGKSVRVGQITPFTFEHFQTVIKELFSIESKDNEEYNPSNDKARAIMDKINAGKAKIAAQRGQTAITENSSIYAMYVSILSIGMNMDMNILYNYTPFQIQDSFKRYIAKVADDFYRKIATTPLMDVSKVEEPDSWTNNLYTMESKSS